MRTATAVLALLALPAFAQDSDLLVFDYSGFEDPAFHPDYVEAHGASPEFSFFGDEDEALQKLRSGFAADVSHVCAGSVPRWIDAGILEPWDTSRIERFEEIDAALTGQDMIGEGEVFFVPVDFGSTAIAYNADEVSAEDVGTLEVFKNPAFAGRLAIPDNVDDAYALAYLATGVTDWGQVGDAEFEAATQWLRDVHPNLRTYWVDPAELSQLLASGEVLASWAWNETLPTMAETGFPIGFEREATEGSSLWLCGYVKLASGEGSDDKAYDFLNAMLSPTAADALMGAGYGQSTMIGTGAVTEEQLVDAGLHAIDAPVLAQLPLDPALRDRQSETFEMIKAGF